MANSSNRCAPKSAVIYSEKRGESLHARPEPSLAHLIAAAAVSGCFFPLLSPTKHPKGPTRQTLDMRAAGLPVYQSASPAINQLTEEYARQVRLL